MIDVLLDVGTRRIVATAPDARHFAGIVGRRGTGSLKPPRCGCEGVTRPGTRCGSNQQRAGYRRSQRRHTPHQQRAPGSAGRGTFRRPARAARASESIGETRLTAPAAVCASLKPRTAFPRIAGLLVRREPVAQALRRTVQRHSASCVDVREVTRRRASPTGDRTHDAYRPLTRRAGDVWRRLDDRDRGGIEFHGGGP